MVHRKSTNSGPQAVTFLVLSFHSFEKMFLRKKFGKTFISMSKFKCVFPAKDLPLLENHKNIKRKSHCSNMEQIINQNKNSSFQNTTSST